MDKILKPQRLQDDKLSLVWRCFRMVTHLDKILQAAAAYRMTERLDNR